jgi:dTDP-glucose 4,6-dehydratase
VDATARAPFGNGDVSLFGFERAPRLGLELVGPERFEEGPSVIPMDNRKDLPRVRDGKLTKFHVGKPSDASPGRFDRLAGVRILVTGGAGFIGSNFVRRTLTDSYPALASAEITVLDALTYSGNIENLAPVAESPRFSFVQGSIGDAALLDGILPGVDSIVHFAAESHVDRSVHDASPFYLTNVIGTQVLYDAAVKHGVSRVVHVSTDEVYGSIAEGSWTESSILEPNSPYSASKAASDLVARAWHVTHGLNVSITRCSNNYGPYHFPEKLIPLFITNLMDGGHVPLYGDGENVRDWLHVDDHCRGIALVLARGGAGEIYNIGGGTELTNRRLTELLLEKTGRDWSYVDPAPDRLGHDRRYSVDISKISSELGYAPEVEFEAGLDAVVDWYRDNRGWWEPLKTRAGLS